MNAPRLRLKHAAGWFAAGREVAEAMGLLSDAAFKVFFWLCLHAERGSGRLLVEPKTIARSVGKTEAEIVAILGDLFQGEICRRVSGGFLEITDRFWPYQRAAPPLAAKDVWTYTAKVKELMQARACVRSSFSAADYKLAQELYQRQIPLQTVERAIHLGCLRKYAALLHHQGGDLITSLHYFTVLLEEVQRLEVSDQYWSYVGLKLRQLERQWQPSRPPSAVVSAPPQRRNNEASETK
ncbi:MAG TPA: hypothetical protein VMU80_05040 [Bryobacteraceae bacterium]|nr:hypothetical protein [Bryobacteraceae bacterium]